MLIDFQPFLVWVILLVFTRQRLEIFGHLYLENLHQIKLPQILRFIEATGLDPLPEENPETAEINLLNIADEEENIDNN